MKKFLLTLGLLFGSTVMAEGSGPMLGIILGYPTGLSFRQKTSADHSMDAGLAYSLLSGSMHLHADYLWDDAKTLHLEKQPIEFYYGIGARLASGNTRRSSFFALGPRFPFGLATNFETPRLQLFAEIAPIVDLIPAVDVDLHVGIGLRYRF